MANDKKSADDKFGIVIDSGSSGSRIQIYKWTDQKIQSKSSDNSVLQSPPKIVQEKEWTKKISPGISTFSTKDKYGKIWQDHYSELMKFAESIIPANKHAETPVFVLSTAGMRMLPKKTRKTIIKETCKGIKQHTNFYIPTENCENFVETIDGSTEGIYGWVGLNYLMGQFNNYDSAQSELHESIGFMDMGGASTQIAFVPSSKEQITKHAEDLSKVTLRNINGETQTWDLFVATWLGFGANEARKRFLNQLINLSIVNENNWNPEISDPCMPKGATMDYKYDGKDYKIQGVGNYEMCVKTIYPLLMKNMPCIDEPCLFNGIHGPKLNFEKDKFIGISEYWYTANDIFQSGGEYNYKAFNAKVKEYCSSDWTQILKNSENGQYLNLDPDKFLKDACFKASWILNVLHEGFELPRIGFETDNEDLNKPDKEIVDAHVPFKSAGSIEGEELSWTLGKILLFASSQIESKDKATTEIGIYPSEISGQKFVPGGILSSSKNADYSSDDDDESFGSKLSQSLYSLIFVLLLLFFIYRFGKSHIARWTNKFQKFNIPIRVKSTINKVGSKIPGVKGYFENIVMYQNLQDQSIILEEGISDSNNINLKGLDNHTEPSVLRTRSAIGLNEEFKPDSNTSNPRTNNFLNKPFVVPKKNFPFSAANNSSESLTRSSSNPTIPRAKSSLD
ncbi:Golgi apyrase [Candida maltosa Xu316]|uniref:Golgi apyrase n=1 Tax=Candida maltosa (strain Xu316) TaxID=1245528 RepID=M3J4X9_CANMX|nr:Golgi apyrase [Candida maltosa Xu316]